MSEENPQNLEQIPGQAQENTSGAPKHPDMKWYIVHAHTGFEAKAKTSLQERAQRLGKADLFGEVLIPTESVVELVKGQKKSTQRKVYPGYMLLQMVLNDETWHIVKGTSKISGFVGDARNPAALSAEEVARISNQMVEGVAKARPKFNFKEGETVRVIDGPFANFNGTVEEVRPEKNKLRVLVSIFGRATPVELDFIQVEKS
jgi:transcriptional antiterminator NusG